MIKISPSILNSVLKPARYTGGELNSVIKDHNKVEATIALALPDVYEVGMSNLGLKILYEVLNDRADLAAERVYAPWVDMENELSCNKISLYSLETYTPLKNFDVLGFSLQYELIYSNVINMLHLSNIPLLSSERKLEDPFVIGGGPCAFNPEPVADFFDFFIIGEGEEIILEVMDVIISWKQSNKIDGRKGLLRRVAQIQGIYVPSFYAVNYNSDNTIKEIISIEQTAPSIINKRIVADLDNAKFPTKPVVPFIDIVHDRIMLELFRGCTRGCRFCQAGVIYRPVRERKMETLIKLAEDLIKNTGYDEISLTSLSSADYSKLSELVDCLMDKFKKDKVSISLPSLRIDSFSVDLAQKVQEVRKSGLTFAPEAGTQRLRDVINKGVTEEHLITAVSAAFAKGWSGVKLYFMIGLPTESDEDIIGIATLAQKVVNCYKEVTGKRGARVTVSVSSFVPKPHTPFQWYAQNTTAEINRKQQLLKENIKDKSISFKYHDARTSYMEGVFARGDRRLSKVIMEAWKQGAKFDGWSDFFNYDNWLEALAKCNLEPDFYVTRERNMTEVLPWDHIGTGATKKFLITEYEQAVNEQYTVDCRRDTCSICGVCQNLDVKVIDWRNARD